MNTYLERFGAELDAAAERLVAGQRPRDRRPLLPAAFAVVVAVAAIAIGVAVVRPTADPESEVGPAGSSAVDHFEILRRPVTAADAIPKQWRDMWPGRGKSVGEARSETFGEVTIWVAPAGGGVCLFAGSAETFGGACRPPAGNLLTEGTIGRLAQPGAERTYGLIPDGATKLQFVLAGGERVPVELRANLFAALTPVDATSIEWTDAQGDPHSHNVVAPTEAPRTTDPPDTEADFPINSSGQSYGSTDGVAFDQHPDLILVQATNGRNGYVDRVVLNEITGANVSSPEEAVAYQKEQNARGRESQFIPVYEKDGTTQIGQFEIGRSETMELTRP